VTAAWAAEQRNEDPEAFGDGLIAAYDRIFGRAANHEALGEQRARSDDPLRPHGGGS
jgi:hypothetical protein